MAGAEPDALAQAFLYLSMVDLASVRIYYDIKIRCLTDIVYLEKQIFPDVRKKNIFEI